MDKVMHLWQARFPNQNVVKKKENDCLEEKDGHGSLKTLLWICPNEGGSSIFPEYWKGCSTSLLNDHFKSCSSITLANSDVEVTTMQIVLIVVVTVFVCLLLLLLGVLMCWKRKAVKTFAKQHCSCASKCR